MNRLLVFLFPLCMIHAAYAIDATNSMTEIDKSGHWQVAEFAGAKQLIYRIASESINSTGNYITFDFVPSKNCSPTPAGMITQLNSYSDNLNNGLLIIAYKLPNQKKEAMELTKTEMSEGDTFVFYSLEKLTTKTLLQSADKGKLAIWIPASGDGTIKRSGNIYFSLEGFSLAYSKAKRSCGDNK